LSGPARSPPQQAQARRLKAEDRLLPDAAVDVTRVRSTDAVVHYAADAVTSGSGLPLRRVRLDVVLDHGVVTADPAAFEFSFGQISGRLRLDARGRTPKAGVDLVMSRVRVEDFFRGDPHPPLEGLVHARAQLTGVGASVRQIAATANGVLAVVAPRGEVRQSLAELAGVDVIKGLGLLLAKNQRDIGVRCAVADFQARNGVFTARNLLFDTQTVLVTGEGTVDLRDETLDLTLKGRPKQFRLVRLKAPITVRGSLRSPKVGIEPGAAPAQAGAAIALGAFLTPLAAVLPFVAPGLAHDADCAAAEADPGARRAPASISPGRSGLAAAASR